MLNPNQPPLTPAEFDEVLRDHAEVIRLANDLELSLYEIGESDPPDRGRVSTCQQTAGGLLQRLRALLFRLDQQVYPRVDPGEPTANG